MDGETVKIVTTVFFGLLSRGPGATEACLLFTLAEAVFTGIVTGPELNIVAPPI
jgi:hypothetical protein